MGLEFLSAFYASVVWYELIIIAVIFSLSVGFMMNESGTIPFIGVMGLLIYNWTGTGAILTFSSLLNAWVFILVYIIIGLLWSFFKWGRLVKYYIGEHKNEEDVRFSLKNVSNDRIAYWILWWPLSAIGFIFEDAIQWIIEHFKGVYNMITDRLINGAYTVEKTKTTRKRKTKVNND